MAGNEFNLTCNVNAVQYLAPSAILTLNLSGKGSDTSEVTELINTGVKSVLSFNPLKTTHGGNYHCEVAIKIPPINTNKSGSNTMDLKVQREDSACIDVQKLLHPVFLSIFLSPNSSGIDIS